MVSGLSGLIRSSGDSYIFEPSTSRYIVAHPVELLFDAFRRFKPNDHIGAYGVDFLRAKALFDSVLKDILESDISPIFLINGLENNHVRFQLANAFSI